MIATADLYAQFDRFLDGQGPVGVAVSGGGDSVALLLLLAQWGRRPLRVFCVDHGLNPDSAGWTQTVARLAHRLGAAFTPLAWTGEKPHQGVSAAARTARHALLADAARAHGVRVLCLGHTRDDIAEAEAMRATGSNVGSPQRWAPSPAWPQGRGVFIFRPLLSVRRSVLRDWLASQGEGWIDDPANANPQSLRARARLNLPDELPPYHPPPPLLTRAEAEALIDPQYADQGLLILRRGIVAPDRMPGLLALAVVCAGGGSRLPRSAEVVRLIDEPDRPHTLCGARIEADASAFYVARDAGDMRRRPLGGELWDGRFEATGDVVASYAIRPRPDEVRAFPAMVRDSLPCIAIPANTTLRQSGYSLAGYGLIGATCWVLPRWLAAAGVITRESELG